ncbi:head-tail connector protein [Neobacillus vireti]|uniref:head-tail connector protein n=1 Tax=Neobacillus vireti TaxID=220686 RepID=UPI002FFEDF14
MKISEVGIRELKEYAREYNDDVETIKTFELILVAGKAYIKGYTGLTDEQLDTHEDLTIVLMVLSNEMYDNRVFSVESDKVNTVIKSILDMHSVNLL